MWPLQLPSPSLPRPFSPSPLSLLRQLFSIYLCLSPTQPLFRFSSLIPFPLLLIPPFSIPLLRYLPLNSSSLLPRPFTLIPPPLLSHFRSLPPIPFPYLLPHPFPPPRNPLPPFLLHPLSPPPFSLFPPLSPLFTSSLVDL